MKKHIALVILLGLIALVGPTLVIGSGEDSFVSYLLFTVGDSGGAGKWFWVEADDEENILWVGPGGVLVVPDPPEDFQAIAASSSSITLTWINPNNWAGLECVIHMEAGEYPNDPPSNIDGSTEVFNQLAAPLGAHTYTVIGLTAGTTYYFRIWFYDPVALTYTTYDEDWTTTTAGPVTPPSTSAPSNWFLDPTCDFWENVPMAMNIINGIEDKMGIDSDFLCMIISLLLLSAIMQLSFGGMAIQTGEPTGTRTILIPFAIMCVGFIVGPIVGAFPGFFLLIAIVLGLGIAYAWSRA